MVCLFWVQVNLRVGNLEKEVKVLMISMSDIIMRKIIDRSNESWVSV
jgi:hypothetical protein